MGELRFVGRPMVVAAALALMSAAIFSPAVGGISGAAAAAVPQLAGTTVMTGSGSGDTIVHLASAATMMFDSSYRSSPDVEISAAGRFAGVALWSASSDVTLVLAEVDLCRTPGCATSPHQLVAYISGEGASPWPGTPGQVGLPAGDYELRLFGDGSVVRVTLRLNGVGGSSAINISGTGTTDIVDLSQSLGLPAAPALFSAGSTHTFDTPRGLLLYQISTETVGANTMGNCVYYGAQPTGYQYVPFCPAVSGGGPQEDSFVVDPLLLTYRTGAVVVPQGTIGAGMYFGGVSLSPEGVVASEAWIPFGKTDRTLVDGGSHRARPANHAAMPHILVANRPIEL